MNRIKNWIRWKLINFLGINDLINILDKHIDNSDSTFQAIQKSSSNDIEKIHYKIDKISCENEKYIRDLKRDLVDAQDSISILQNTIKSIVSIGVDEHQLPIESDRNNSWAVICIEGNYNIVKFVDLRGQYTRDILHFLKQFDGSRRVIDSPYKNLFEKEYFKF